MTPSPRPSQPQVNATSRAFTSEADNRHVVEWVIGLLACSCDGLEQGISRKRHTGGVPSTASTQQRPARSGVLRCSCRVIEAVSVPGTNISQGWIKSLFGP